MLRPAVAIAILASSILLSIPSQSLAVCRAAFDMGSSGIRAGSDSSTISPKADFDFLGPLTNPETFPGVAAPAARAIADLSSKASIPADCQSVAAGFSAWRRAASANSPLLARTIREIREKSGVPIVVIPQSVEGSYGLSSARSALGHALSSSHILDIGGGSLQVSGPEGSYGGPFGQRLWLAEMCRTFGIADGKCRLEPVSPYELASLRERSLSLMSPILRNLPEGSTLTAISKPVSRGILPALRKIATGPADSLSLSETSSAIALLAALDFESLSKTTGIAPERSAHLLSDMLLVEAVLIAARATSLSVADADISNVPGIDMLEEALHKKLSRRKGKEERDRRRRDDYED